MKKQTIKEQKITDELLQALIEAACICDDEKREIVKAMIAKYFLEVHRNALVDLSGIEGNELKEMFEQYDEKRLIDLAIMQTIDLNILYSGISHINVEHHLEVDKNGLYFALIKICSGKIEKTLKEIYRRYLVETKKEK